MVDCGFWGLTSKLQQLRNGVHIELTLIVRWLLRIDDTVARASRTTNMNLEFGRMLVNRIEDRITSGSFVQMIEESEADLEALEERIARMYEARAPSKVRFEISRSFNLRKYGKNV